MKKDEVKKSSKKLDFSALKVEETKKIHGAGWNYCPKNDTYDAAMCCQSQYPAGPDGEWWCPH